MKRTAILPIAILTIAAATAANAADAYRADSLKDRPSAIVPADAPGWTRIYFGAGIQGDSVNHDIKAAEKGVDGDYTYTGTAELNGLGATGAGAALVVGADYQINPRIVVGAQFGYEFANASSKLTAAETEAYKGTVTHSDSFAANYDLTSQWEVVGRGGFLLTPSTLLYGKVGYGEATFKAGGELAKVDGFKSDNTYSGIVWGGGIETHVDWAWKGATVRLEYSDFIGDTKTLYHDKELTITNAPEIQSVKLIVAAGLGLGDTPLK